MKLTEVRAEGWSQQSGKLIVATRNLRKEISRKPYDVVLQKAWEQFDAALSEFVSNQCDNLLVLEYIVYEGKGRKP